MRGLRACRSLGVCCACIGLPFALALHQPQGHWDAHTPPPPGAPEQQGEGGGQEQNQQHMQQQPQGYYDQPPAYVQDQQYSQNAGGVPYAYDYQNGVEDAQQQQQVGYPYDNGQQMGYHNDPQGMYQGSHWTQYQSEQQPAPGVGSKLKGIVSRVKDRMQDAVESSQGKGYPGWAAPAQNYGQYEQQHYPASPPSLPDQSWGYGDDQQQQQQQPPSYDQEQSWGDSNVSSSAWAPVSPPAAEEPEAPPAEDLYSLDGYDWESATGSQGPVASYQPEPAAMDPPGCAVQPPEVGTTREPPLHSVPADKTIKEGNRWEAEIDDSVQEGARESPEGEAEEIKHQYEVSDTSGEHFHPASWPGKEWRGDLRGNEQDARSDIPAYERASSEQLTSTSERRDLEPEDQSSSRETKESGDQDHVLDGSSSDFMAALEAELDSFTAEVSSFFDEQQEGGEELMQPPEQQPLMEQEQEQVTQAAMDSNYDDVDDHYDNTQPLEPIELPPAAAKDDMWNDTDLQEQLDRYWEQVKSAPEVGSPWMGGGAPPSLDEGEEQQIMAYGTGGYGVREAGGRNSFGQLVPEASEAAKTSSPTQPIHIYGDVHIYNAGQGGGAAPYSHGGGNHWTNSGNR